MTTYSNPLTEYAPQMEGPELFSETEFSGGFSGSVFGEFEEMELAAGLLEVRDEAELDHFLTSLVRAAGKAIGKVVKGPTAAAVGRLVKTIVGKALPVAGAAVGGWFGGPLGAQFGKSLAATAGKTLGLELEGLSPEDREFEAVRQFIRFAGEAVRNALEAEQTGDRNPAAAPAALARRATVQAGGAYAPGLVDLAKAPLQQQGVQSFKERRKSGDNAMHDLDRTQAEYEYEMENAPFQSYEEENPSYESYEEESGLYESEQPYQSEQYEGEQPYEMEQSYESEQPVFNETEEMELVSELMELNSEEELESLIGSIIRKAARAAGGYISSKTGQSLGSLLKGAATAILPVVTEGLGQVGEYESEGYSESEMEEREWEAASTFVKLAGEASKIAAQAPPDAAPAAVADQAVTQAAQTHAPALVGPPDQAPVGPASMGPPPTAAGSAGSFASPSMRPRRRRIRVRSYGIGPHRRHGRWMRRGNQIILYEA